jgi:acyl-ACP thioesterase
VPEFVPLSDRGRRFSEEFVVRLGDADERGLLRVDGVARILQDVATDDWNDTDVDDDDTWVVRRTSLRSVRGASWPRYLERMNVTTWCGGVGVAWAERRTSFEVDGSTVLEAVALWVPVDATGHPVRLRESFFHAYGESARDRKVSSRVTVDEVPVDATRQRWTLRTADVDMVGHVNNAALWQAVSEVIDVPVGGVSVTHHRSIERDDPVELVTAPGAVWLVVHDEVRVSAHFEVSTLA